MNDAELLQRSFEVQPGRVLQVIRIVSEYHLICVQMEDGTYEMLATTWRGDDVRLFRWTKPEVHEILRHSEIDPVVSHGIGFGYEYVGVQRPGQRPSLIKIVRNENHCYEEWFGPESPVAVKALTMLGL